MPFVTLNDIRLAHPDSGKHGRTHRTAGIGWHGAGVGRAAACALVMLTALLSAPPAAHATPREGELRLVGGTSSAGRLELFSNQKWLALCTSSFDHLDAAVACGQLEFSSATGISLAPGCTKTKLESGLTAINCTGATLSSGFMSKMRFHCSGVESRLVDCRRSYGGCFPNEQLHISCGGTPVPEVSVAAAATSVTEGAAARFIVTRAGGNPGPLTVKMLVEETGHTIPGMERRYTTQGQLWSDVSFAAGVSTTTLSVPTSDDLITETDSRVTAKVAGRKSTFTSTAGSPPSATLSVVDNDPADRDHIKAGAKPLGAVAPEDAAGSTADSVNGVSDKVDYHTFTLSQPARIELTLSGLQHDADLVLERASGAVVASSTTTGTTDEEIDLAIAAGQWYVRVVARARAKNGYVLGYDATALTASEMLSNDATLTALTLSDVDIGTFASSTLDYPATVPYAVERTTVTATPAAGASVSVVPVDARSAAGHQVYLPSGAETGITMTVTAANGTAMQTYTVRITRAAVSSTPASGDLRLVGGDSHEGTLQVFLKETWGTVCDDYFTRREANVACGQLGYPAAAAMSNQAGSGPVLMDNVKCSGGNQSRLVDCAWHDRPNCWHYEDVHVTCATAPLPEVTIVADALSVAEGAAATFTLTRSGQTAGALTVKVKVTETHDAIAGTAPSSVAFAAGATTAVLSVSTEDDQDVEDDSKLTARIVHQDQRTYDYVVGPVSAAAVTVISEDAQFQGSMHRAEVVTKLAAHYATIPATHDGSSAFTVQIEFSEAVAITAQEMRDAGVEVTAGTVTAASLVDGRDDLWELTIEPDSNADVTVLLRPGRPCAERGAICTSDDQQLEVGLVAIVAGPGSSSVVQEDAADAAAEFSVAVAPASIDEGESALLTVTIDNGVTFAEEQEITVALSGTAAAADYTLADGGGQTLSAPYALTLAAGASTVTASVSAVDDGEQEPAETIVITATHGENEIGTQTVTVAASEAALAEVSIAALASPVSEGSAAGFRLSRTAPTAAELTVQVSVTESAAMLQADAPATASFAAGAGSATLTAATANDTVVEGASVVTATLTADATAYRVAAGAKTAAVTVADDDVAQLSLAAAPASIAEQESATLTVAIGNGVTFAEDQEITVAVSGTASEEDYTLADGAGQALAAPYGLTLGSGQTTVTAAVSAVDDGEEEPEETIVITAAHLGSTIGTQTVTVAASEAALKASFEELPEEHDGVSVFTFRVRFNLEPRVSYRVLRDQSFAVTGGQVRRARRVDGRNDLREIHVRPSGYGAVTVTLAGGRACGTVGAICTADNRVLWNTQTATIPGPPGLSVADAQVQEAVNATLDFAVTLSRAPSGEVTVEYATGGGSATAGADYSAQSGTLTFAVGETERTVAVAVVDDARDEPDETFTLTLSNASGAYLADAEATGTIRNNDPLPQAWLARFGRTVAAQVLEAVGHRLGAAAQGQATLGGHRLSAVQEAAAGYDRSGSVELPWLTGLQEQAHAPELGALVAGSSFDLLATGAGAEEGVGAGWTVWGRGAWSRFAGSEETLSLEGEVVTGTVGADYERERLLAGLALSYSVGDGSFEHGSGDSGELHSTLLGVHPYVRLRLHDGLAVWGLLGYALAGELRLEHDRGASVETDVGMVMGAFGARGTLLAAPAGGGLELSASSDGLVLRMRSTAVPGMAAGTAEVERLRLLLHASYRALPLGGGVLIPEVEVGGRYDGGDAESGAGLVVGGSVGYTLPAWGLTLAGYGQGLLVHEQDGFREWGAGGTLLLDPDPPGRGLALQVAPAWGTASSGAAGLWSLPHLALLAATGPIDATGSVDAELSYGLEAGAAGTLTPYLGVAVAPGGDRSWRLGARLRLDPGVTLSLEGTHREHADHTLVLSGSLR